MGKKINAEMLEAMVPAIISAVMAAVEAMDQDDVEDARLEDYAHKEAIKAYRGFDDYPNFLTIKEAAAMLGVNYSRVYELSRAKNTPFTIWSTASKRPKRMVNKHDLIEYLKERRGGYIIDDCEGGK